MPQHAPPKTLKNLAFENIIKHVDSVWTSQYVKDWGNKHLLYVEGPFDILTPAGEYIETLTKNLTLAKKWADNEKYFILLQFE